MKKILGIDTGGTYTDAVIFDADTSAVLSAAKSPTTHGDLTTGIKNAICGLDGLSDIRLVSLSTTLATNACVEGRGADAALCLIGAEKSVVYESGAKYGLPDAKDIVLADSRVLVSGAIERDADYDAMLAEMKEKTPEPQAFAVVALNAVKNDAVQEKKAKRILSDSFQKPIVCGHELFSELNCLRRGAGALLNASLLPISEGFIAAVKSFLRDFGITAPFVVVRSDGSVMNESVTKERPVETLLSGPAASLMGALQLTGEKTAVVIDMGGTTTDIAVARSGVPVMAENGVSIGKWKTFVRGLFVSTFALGGDSAVRLANGQLRLEHYRAVPLCMLAKMYPEIKSHMQEVLADSGHIYTDDCEFVVLSQDSFNIHTDESGRRVMDALRSGPLMLKQLAKTLDTDVVTLSRSYLPSLIKKGAVLRSCFTPTDAMHIKGDFSAFDKEAAVLGAELICLSSRIKRNELCVAVYSMVKKRLYCGIIEALCEQRTGEKHAVPYEIIQQSFDDTESGDTGFLSIPFQVNVPLIGIGAPLKLFLPDVARMLGTAAVIPEHAEVANAVGAAAGNIFVESRVEIKAVSVAGAHKYAVYGENGMQAFDELDGAFALAESRAAEDAEKKARARGLAGKITVEINRETENAVIGGGNIFISAAVTAAAKGKII